MLPSVNEDQKMGRIYRSICATSAAAVLGFSGVAQASPIQSATSTLGGTAINFEGMSEGQIISNQYSGVAFSQVDGGTPQIDNSPFLFGYNASSGTGVLTGSTNGGAPFPTVAGLVLTLASPGSAIEFFLGDTSPLGPYTLQAFNSSNVLIESFAPTPGNFVGFSGLSDLRRVVVDGTVTLDAFAIDDVRFVAAVNTVPEPLGIGLVALGLVALGWSRRQRV